MMNYKILIIGFLVLYIIECRATFPDADVTNDKQDKIKVNTIDTTSAKIDSVMHYHKDDEVSKTDSIKIYQHESFYQPVQIEPKKLNQNNVVKNIILFIGDGMGISQIFTGMTANQGKLNLEYLKYIGFSKTQSYDKYVTDSGAAATAISAGVKTYNGAIGVNADTQKVTTILELAEENGLSTGLISTSSITHATPAAFISHQKSRHMYEAIARDFLNTDVDVVIGGGQNHFARRKDGQSLLPLLQQKGYDVITDADQLTINANQKIFALLDSIHLPTADYRNDFLIRATEIALNRLSQNKNGFFLMVEGSQIDWGGHANNTGYVVKEMLDFDRAIGVALEFAEKNGETLIICTADHETGGMAILSGDILSGQVEAGYVTKSHSGVMVPVFAIGPGADSLIGIYENIELFFKMKLLLNL